MPISIHLAEYLRPLVGNRAAGEFLIPGCKSRKGLSAAIPRNTLANAWEQAVVAKLVRLEVWKPTNRTNGRPDHAFRAAFQAHLVRHGVQDAIIDKLVGHSEGLRARHYVDADAMWPAMVAAVALLPPIDWSGVVRD
jgi:hypothetical protein